MPTVLSLWLKNVPVYTVLLARLAILDVFVDSLTHSLVAGVGATGNIKYLYIMVAGLVFLNLPVSWVALSLSALVYSVWIIAILLTIIIFIVRLIWAERIIVFSLKKFVKEIMLPCSTISLLSAVFPVLLFFVLKHGFLRLCLISMSSIISTCIFMYLIGLNSTERQGIRIIIRNRLRRGL
jgi:hypothetical protein